MAIPTRVPKIRNRSRSMAARHMSRITASRTFVSSQSVIGIRPVLHTVSSQPMSWSEGRGPFISLRNDPSGNASLGNGRGRASQMPWARLNRKKLTPIAVISAVRRGALRSGR